ncbi:TonB-dependent receptor plug domain-containing protein [Woeseia oceani]|uniref:TonB-dependent receptor n=1 Tax=Woeseia oceani TaxID=1548547 RepID=A0A193LDK5_9GAMM|nr:TonB-dependent receptor [Woeseia oceani]ANO50464.1 hypothetical protein BA177_03890 [Woeseia oceani]
MAVMCAVSSGALAIPAVSQAQQDDNAVEEIVVTGSHIRRDTFSSSSPITVVDSELIGQVGETNLGDFLERVPSITSGSNGSNTSGNAGMSTGLNTASLRNLGSERTLVLVNGRRFVSGVSASSGYGVDLNAIPTAIIERIEVLTGNQSAVYGSDAMAGVINVITKTNFEGVKLHAQTGQATEGDRQRNDIDITLGKNFEGGGNVWVSMAYSDASEVWMRDRDYAPYSLTGVDTTGDGLRDSLQFEGSSFIPESRLLGMGVDIKGDGSPFEGSRNVDTSDRLNFHDFWLLRLPQEKQYVSAGLNLPLSEKTAATVQMNYSRIESSGRFEPLPLNTVTETFRTTAGGASNMDLATHPLWAGSSAGAQFLAAGATTLDDISNTFRRVNEFGPLGNDALRTTFRVVGAVDHDFDNGMRLDVSAVYGVTDSDVFFNGDINLERAATALNIEPDGFGGYQCVDAVARLQGCVPYNPFNTVDSVAGVAGVTGFSEEAINYLSVNLSSQGKIEQTVVSAVLSGEMPFSVGQQDNIGFATGIEYRKEAAEEIPDGLRQAGLTRVQNLQATGGEFDVAEIYGELNIPLMDKLILEVAGRFGDYSSVGNISSWKVGLDAPINDSVRFRAATSSAIRAPNVSDLFAGGTNSAGATVDPCDGVTNATTGNVAENCRTLAAIQNRIDTTGAFTLSQIESQMTRVLSSGNPNVQEETAMSYSAGVIFTPVSLEAFSIAADFYSIEIEDQIGRQSKGQILDDCHEVSPTSFDPTCGGVLVRDPAAGAMLELQVGTVNNPEKSEFSGVDLETAYQFGQVGPGDLMVSLGANFIIHAGRKDENQKGQLLYPDYRFNLNVDYSIKDVDLFATWRYRAESKDRVNNTVNAPNLNTMKAASYLDVRASYRATDTVQVYLGATNLFDASPQLMGFTHASRNTAGTNGTVYDVIGRQVFAGLNVDF